jgi:hypothetical protein
MCVKHIHFLQVGSLHTRQQQEFPVICFSPRVMYKMLSNTAPNLKKGKSYLLIFASEMNFITALSGIFIYLGH